MFIQLTARILVYHCANKKLFFGPRFGTGILCMLNDVRYDAVRPPLSVASKLV